jgi:hypothetical protein
MIDIKALNRNRSRALSHIDALLLAIRTIMPFDALRALDLAGDLRAVIEVVNALEEERDDAMGRVAKPTTDQPTPTP